MNTNPAARPPRWARRLLYWFCAPHRLEEMENDLDELFCQRVESVGLGQARWRYVRDVVSLMRPWIIKRKPNQYSNPSFTDMLSNYVKIAWRNLIKNKAYAFITIFGLSTGLCCFAFIALWVQDELSYDQFHSHHTRIVRLTTTKKTESGLVESARSGAPLATALRQAFAEVENTVRLDRREEIVQHDNQQRLQAGIILTDPSFFDVFSYRLTRGNVATALREPYSVVLTQSTAAKYFGKADPMGQSLLIYMYDSTGRGAHYKVTGITPDPPRNAHFTFTMLGSFKTIELTKPEVVADQGWADQRYYTYVLLDKGVDRAAFAPKLASFYATHTPDPEQALATGPSVRLGRLQPLSEIHLSSHLENEITPNGSRSQVYIFSTIALFILLLAGINYTNLATARSVGRAKEVGIRKVVGVGKTQLMVQYLSESVGVALIAFGLSVLVSALLQPFFYQITDKPLSLFASPRLLLLLAGVSIVLGMLAGVYPAFVLASFKPVSTLKGVFSSGTKGVVLRQSLVVAQFVITLILTTSIVIINAQMSYIKHKDLGYDKEALLYLRHNGNADVVKGYSAFKNDLLGSPLIGGVTAFRSGLEGGSAETTDPTGKPIRLTLARLGIDADYLPVHGVKLIAGRNVPPRATPDTIQPIVLNETAVKKAGWPNAEVAIGKPFMLDNQPGMVVGVVRDFHLSSLHHLIEPLALSSRDGYFSRITVKIDPKKAAQSLDLIEAIWARHFPVALFDYAFVDKQLGEQYRAQERFSTIILVFSILSLVIACLGLYGLIAHSLSQKTKEIGIRKVLGATLNGLALMLSQDFLKLVVLASVVALPFAWFVMHRWLQDFAYQIDMAWWMFAASVLLVLVIAILTVSYQTLKAALRNPVKSLRSE